MALRSSSAPIFLIGFMGVGKSTVGRLLGQRLGRPFVDLDDQITEEAGSPITEIFARDGEAGFRAREAEALRKSAGTTAVVAVGGGAPAWPGNLDVMRAAGPVVLLSADTGTLVRRLTAERGTGAGVLGRPLLADAAREGRLAERIAELCARRAAAYAQADVVIDTAGRTPEEVAAEVARVLHLPDHAGAGP